MENKTDIYIETISSSDSFASASVKDRQTVPTGVTEDVLGHVLQVNSQVVQKLDETIHWVKDFFDSRHFADETKVEFSLGVTSKGTVCILSGETSLGIKVTLKWKRKEMA